MPRRAGLVMAFVAVTLAACGGGAEPRYPGYVEGEFVYVGPAVAGRLQSLAVQRGERVAAGAALFELEPDVESLGRQAAGARADAAAAQAADLRKGRRAQELRAIEQQLAEARSALVLAERELARGRAVAPQGYLSAGRLDELDAARDAAAARVARLEAELAVAREAARPDQIAAAEAALRASQSELGVSAWRERQTRGVAPAAGLVQDVVHRPGEWVAQGAPVVALLPDGAVKLRFFVPQAALSAFAPGARVAVDCDGCPAGLGAVVSFVAAQAEFTPPVIYSNESRSKLVFLVEAVPEGEAGRALRPGQPVDVRLAR